VQKKVLSTVRAAQRLVKHGREIGANVLVPIPILDFLTKESSLMGIDMEMANSPFPMVIAIMEAGKTTNFMDMDDTSIGMVMYMWEISLMGV